MTGPPFTHFLWVPEEREKDVDGHLAMNKFLCIKIVVQSKLLLATTLFTYRVFYVYVCFEPNRRN